MTFRRLVQIVLIVSPGLQTSVALAQDPPPRAVRRMFSADTPPPEAGHRLTMTLALGAGHENDLTARGADVAESFRGRDHHTALQAQLQYMKTGTNQLSATARTMLRYYPQLRAVTTMNHGAGIGLAVPLGERTRLRVNQGASYSPQYALNVFPVLTAAELGAPPVTNFDYMVEIRPAYSYQMTSDLTRRIGRRASVALEYGFRYTDFVNKAHRDGREERSALRFTWPVSRHAALKTGYGYRIGASADRRRIHSHDLELGIDYSRQLSISRGASVGFASGSSIVALADGSQYVVSGSALFKQEIGRSWSTHLAFRRGLDFTEYFRDPSVSESIGAGIGGLVTRRVDLMLSAAYMRGRVGPTLHSHSYDAYTGSFRLRVAASRHVALEAQYSYYGDRLPAEVAGDRRASNDVARQVARLGLVFWAPLVEKRVKR